MPQLELLVFKSTQAVPHWVCPATQELPLPPTPALPAESAVPPAASPVMLVDVSLLHPNPKGPARASDSTSAEDLDMKISVQGLWQLRIPLKMEWALPIKPSTMFGEPWMITKTWHHKGHETQRNRKANQPVVPRFNRIEANEDELPRQIRVKEGAFDALGPDGGVESPITSTGARY